MNDSLTPLPCRRGLDVISDVLPISLTLLHFRRGTIVSGGGSESVSLHIRRTDYIDDADNRKIYGDICTEEYYQRCIDIILDQHPDATFYVFTNDKEYASSHYQGDRFVVVGADTPDSALSGAELSDSEEFHLMRFCKHHIMANSSFSWWASWLSEDDDAIILCPPSWIRINGQTVAPPGLYTSQMRPVI